MPVVINHPKTLISDKIIEELKVFTDELGQVVIHGLVKSNTDPVFLRIWPTTYLFDQNSSHISELVYFEKISGFPIWTQIMAGKEYSFTLVFTGLPKSCKLFDLHEIIPQSSGFYIPSIHRNATDIYYLDFC